MTKDRRLREKAAGVALTLVAVIGLGGCGETQPYVYTAREFDRGDANFNKPPTDRKRLTICYNGIGTSDGDLLALAEAECAKFGKQAAALSERFGPCPLLTPLAAVFACTAADGEPAGAAPAPAVSGTP